MKTVGEQEHSVGALSWARAICDIEERRRRERERANSRIDVDVLDVDIIIGFVSVERAVLLAVMIFSR